MRSVKSLIAAGAATLMSSMAFAADMPIAPPPMVYAPPVEDFGGWYLRGDIGFSNQRVEPLEQRRRPPPHVARSEPRASTPRASSVSAPVIKFNNWFRADVTGEYRGKSQFSRNGRIHLSAAAALGADTYHATKSEWVVLANAYVDLGTWWCMTPFIGAGVGGARVTINNFTDTGIANLGAGALPGLAFGDNTSKWNLAWAVHAGVAYQVSPNFTVELAYRYLDMGDGLTGDLRTFDGTNDNSTPRLSRTSPRTTSSSACAGISTARTGVRAAAAGAQRLIRTIIG